MDLIQSILMGIVQGFSEFLPISSSAHLSFTSAFYNLFTGNEAEIASGEEIFVSMMFHIGTLFAVLLFFKKEIFDIIKALFYAVKNKTLENNDDAKLGIYIVIATIFTILIAYPLNDISEYLMYAPNVVGGLLVLTGIYLLLAERFKTNKCKTVNLMQAIIIGIAQGIAGFPGFSRSGLTIATGLFLGLDRVRSSKFSFLLCFPIILGASVCYPLLELKFSDIVNYNWSGIILGTIASAVVGYLCIKYFLKFVAKFSLAFFAYYCIVVGLFATVFFSIFKVGG